MTYFLVADSGATKTEWCLITKKDIITTFETKGISPNYMNQQQIEKQLFHELVPHLTKHLNLLQAVYFYGTGCSNKENNLMLIHAFRNILKIEEVHIWHDILGAARSTCQKNKGMVGILGTGSNSCIYNGLTIVEDMVSYGYMFGDYGSGADIGKRIIQSYCDKEMPKDLIEPFEKAGFNYTKIIEGVYKQSVPSRFLASTFPFVLKNKQHLYIQKIINNSLEKYFEKQILPYSSDYLRWPMHIVGSVGYLLQDELKQIAKQHNIELVNVLKTPIHGLVQYHQQH